MLRPRPLGTLIALASLLCVISSNAGAWGRAGHAAVAELAAANLSPAAAAQVEALLVDDLDASGRPSGRKTLAAVASWADEIRDEAVKTDPKAFKGWHVRRNLVCEEGLGACRDGRCVDELILHYTAVLKDRSQDVRTRNEALKWVVHLVGDLHQPLHSGVNANGGGAKVRIEGVELKPGTTFHNVWDSELARAALKGWKSQARLIDAGPLPAQAPTQWMIETKALALREVYQPLAGFNCGGPIAEPIVLDGAYQENSRAVIRAQVERAGLRLAQWLNQSL